MVRLRFDVEFLFEVAGIPA